MAELIARLQEVPEDWQIYATKAGGSIEARDPNGPRYAYVFTDGRRTRYLTDRRWELRRSTTEGDS